MSLAGDIDLFSQYSCWDPPVTTNSLICIWGSSQWPIGNQSVSVILSPELAVPLVRDRGGEFD